MNHRWGARRALDARVRLLASHAMIGTGHIRDLSVTGAFIETRLELHALSLLYLQPAASPLARTRSFWMVASVIRESPGGFGLEWANPTVPHASVSDLIAFFECGETQAFEGPIRLLGMEEFEVRAPV